MTSIILDPAHGKETVGKRSPNGKHREYFWSREVLINTAIKLLDRHPDIDLYFPYLSIENEIPRLERVKQYNNLTVFTDEALVISLHNNAFKNGWNEVRGNEVFTSRGQDRSDYFATSWYNTFKELYPNEVFRQSKWQDGDPDKEADFTILAGYNDIKPIYNSILIELGFMTNKEDVARLSNREYKDKFSDNLANWIISIT